MQLNKHLSVQKAVIWNIEIKMFPRETRQKHFDLMKSF